jgi:hypothetical protein
MNKEYRSVWNESTETWVAAQENARGSKKGSRFSALTAVAKSLVVMFGVCFSVYTPIASASVLCLSDSMGTSTYQSTGGSAGGCSSWITGLSGPYAILDNGSPSGHSALALTSGKAIFYLNSGGSMSSNLLTATASGSNVLLTGLAPGAVNSSSLDAVNGSQLYGVSSSLSTILGGGSAVNADGTVSAPSYALTSANAIDGTSGAKTDIGTAFSTVDTALGKLNNNVSNVSNNVSNVANNLSNTNNNVANINNTVTNRHQRAGHDDRCWCVVPVVSIGK